VALALISIKTCWAGDAAHSSSHCETRRKAPFFQRVGNQWVTTVPCDVDFAMIVIILTKGALDHNAHGKADL
jgi:hypothetical protein